MCRSPTLLRDWCRSRDAPLSLQRMWNRLEPAAGFSPHSFSALCRMSTAPRQRLRSALATGRFDEAQSLLTELRLLAEDEELADAELTLAERLHDCARVRACAGASATRQFRIAHALAAYSTCGLRSAAAELRAACAAQLEHRRHAQCCALADLAEEAIGRPFRILPGATGAALPLLTGSPLPVIRASVNGLPPGSFILDTGASTSVLTRDYCERNRIPYRQTPFPVRSGAGGEIQACPALVERLDLGEIQLQHWTANVIDLNPRLQIAGILSPLSTLRGIATEFDMRRREFRVHPGLSAAEWMSSAGEPVRSARLVWDGGNVFVRATVNGASDGWFLFDSGAAEICLTTAFALQLGLVLNAENAFDSVSAGGTTRVTPGPTVTLAVSGAPPHETESFLIDHAEDPDSPIPLTCSGYLGVSWMAGRRLLVSPDARELLFTEAADIS
jgi:predicted aspartyl protease